MPKGPKLKVGLVFDDSLDSNDGVAQHVKLLGAWLSSQGHQVNYLVGQTKLKQWAGGQVYSLSRNLPVYFNGNKLSIPLLASKNQIRQVLTEEQFDILHVMMPHSPFMAQRIIKSSGPQTAIVGTFHIFPSGNLSRFGSRLLRLAYGRSLRHFSEIVSVSPAAAGFAKSTYGIDSEVVPNPVDVKRFAAAKVPSSLDKAQIVFLGRLVKRKGARQLIEAFSNLANNTGVELVIAGDGAQRQSLEKLVHKLKLFDKVEFRGYIKEDDKPELLASADIACFPSLYGESFGIVLIEAMASRSKTVLGGDNPGYRTVLSDQPALLIDPNDTQAFADRLDELLNDQRLRDAVYKWQQEEVKKYDIEVVGQQILELYDQAIARLSKNGDNKSYE